MPDPQDAWYSAPTIVPRDLQLNPRCDHCKSDDARSGHPVYHPLHRWGPCQVQLLGGEVCGCTNLEARETTALAGG